MDELLRDTVGSERVSTFDQAEALIDVALALLDCRGGPAGRDPAAFHAHELVDRCRDRRGVSARKAP